MENSFWKLSHSEQLDNDVSISEQSRNKFQTDFTFITLPISDVHDTTMVLGTVVDNLTREVMLMGLLGRFGSTPFLVGGRYP